MSSERHRPLAFRVETTFAASSAAMIPERSSVIAAVSGGGDSVALLHLLLRFATRRGWRVTIGHLDHGLRGGSGSDRKFVERLGQDLGLTVLSDRRPVESLRRRGESLEEAARRVRREFLVESATGSGAERIALGHTLDDQAETVLLRLARGASSTALGGMLPAGPGPFVRPLLGLERAELRRWIEARGLSFREDRSNRELRFDRNRLRRLVVPVLTSALNPRASRQIARAAERIREDAALLDSLAEARFALLSRRDGRNRVLVDAVGLAVEPDPLARRIAWRAALQAGVDGRRVVRVHIEGIVDLARRPGGRRIDLPGDLEARRSGDIVVLGPRPDAPKAVEHC